MESEYFDVVDDDEGEHAMQQARERIENHRKGEFTLNLTDETGKPVVGDLEVTQVDHEFLFGAAMTAALTLRDDERMSAAHERAKEVASELLNIVTGKNSLD